MKNISVNNVTLAYESVGSGPPLLFVHGNGEDHTIFDRTADLLKSQFTCYLIDSRGHGQSSPQKEFHYREMAEDMVEFLRALNLRDVTFAGFSDGGIIGLLSCTRTHRISRLIACGANTVPKGLKAGYRWSMQAAHAFTRHPLLRLMLREPDISDEELRSIHARTLIVAGQFDLIRRVETDHIARKIPGAKEIILPWHTHTSYVVHSEKLGQIIREFCRDPSADPV